MLVEGFEYEYRCPIKFCLDKIEDNKYICKNGNETIKPFKIDTREPNPNGTKAKCKGFDGGFEFEKFNQLQLKEI